MPNFLKLVERGFLSDIERIFEGCTPSQIRTHVRCKDFSGFGAIHYAAMSDNPYIIDLFLDNGADKDEKATIHNLTPLHVAITQNKDLAVGALIRHGANKESENSNGDTPLQMALKQLSIDMPFEAITELIISGARIGDLSNYFTFLFMLAVNNKKELLQRLYNYSQESTINALIFPDLFDNRYNVKSLIKCAVEGLAPDVLEFMYNLPAPDPDATVDTRFLIRVVSSSNLFHALGGVLPPSDIFLIPNKVSTSPENPYAFNAEVLNNILGDVKCSCSVKYNGDKFHVDYIYYQNVKYEFDESGRITNLDELMERLNRVIDLMLSHGVDINKEFHGKTILSMTLDAPIPILRLLLLKGARYSTNDLHKAMLEYDAEVVKLIIESGVDVLSPGEVGKTARDIISECSNDRILSSRPEIMMLLGAAETRQLEERERLEAARARLEAARAEAEAMQAEDTDSALVETTRGATEQHGLDRRYSSEGNSNKRYRIA